MTAEPRNVAAIHKTAHVPLEPTRAFEVFTAEMAAWWPLATHSVGLADADTVTFGAGPGGQIVERLADGSTSVWGTVIDWEPPLRVRFSWHPGTPTAESTEVEIRFSARDGGTVVELIHTGWERRPDAAEARCHYESGWDVVFGRYVDVARGTSTAQHGPAQVNSTM